ncbi:MAG TPA: hypothetical protein ENN81_03760 [Phycisphaerales bacterium]|nr:hypothetical protein [Phycisphaerales bacterium]
MTTHEILDILKSRDFDRLKGAVEDERTDFKGEPYRLDQHREKVELAKDVSAFLNAGGGIIVIGAGTVKRPEHRSEAVDRIRAFPKEHLDITQYHNVLGSWVYPKPNVDVQWVPSHTDETRGLAYILISEREGARWPFVVTKLFDEDSRAFGNVVGYFERKRDRVEAMAPAEIQQRMRDGRRFDSYLARSLDLMEEVKRRIETGAAAVAAAHVGNVGSQMDERIANALSASGLASSIKYCLAAYSPTATEVQEIFAGRASAAVKLIDAPPELRYAGFDISPGTESRIVDGKLRRALTRGYKLLDVWRDGTVVSIAPGDGGFLCWNNPRGSDYLRVNPVALIESVCLFVRFVCQLAELCSPSPRVFQVMLRITGIPRGKRLALARGPLSAWDYATEHALKFLDLRELPIEKEYVIAQSPPESVAFKIVAACYTRFGHDFDDIPYTKKDADHRLIDVEAIKALR